MQVKAVLSGKKGFHATTHDSLESRNRALKAVDDFLLDRKFKRTDEREGDTEWRNYQHRDGRKVAISARRTPRNGEFEIGYSAYPNARVYAAHDAVDAIHLQLTPEEARARSIKAWDSRGRGRKERESKREGGESLSKRARRGEMRVATPAERRKYAIPPAYTDAMVAVNPRDPNVDVLATARVPPSENYPNGKPWSKYTDKYNAKNAAGKWKRIVQMQKDMPRLIQKVQKDIDKGSRHEDYAKAITMKIIMETGMRNGGDAGEGIGASNMKMDSVTVSGDSVRFQFVGKGGIEQDHTVENKDIATYVRTRKRTASGDDRLFEHDSRDMLDYQKKITNGKNKVHDVRTYVGTTLASRMVQDIIDAGQTPKTKKEYKALEKAVATAVSKRLGNTPSVALKTYIHPAVLKPLQLD